MEFKAWLEASGKQDIILNFLKDKLNISDDETILQMSTADMEDSVIGDLLNRGIVSTASQDIITRIKNGITIKELIDLLAGEAGGSNFPGPNTQAPPSVDPSRSQAQQAGIHGGYSGG